MEKYLAPAVLVALAGLVAQGIKAALDLYDRAAARQAARRQGDIALCVALMQLTDATSHTSGEILAIKKALVSQLLSDTLSSDLLGTLDL